MRYEAIVYDERDIEQDDPSSTLGFLSSIEEARYEITEYCKHYPQVFKWEIRDKFGKLIEHGVK